MKTRIIITAAAAIVLAFVHFALVHALLCIAIDTSLYAIDNPDFQPSAIERISGPLLWILVAPGAFIWGTGTLVRLALNSLIWGVGLAVLLCNIPTLIRKASGKKGLANRWGLLYLGVILLIVAVVVGVLYLCLCYGSDPGNSPEHDFSVEVSRTESNMTFTFGNGTKMDLALIPAGQFMMGTPEEEEGRGPDGDKYEHHSWAILKFTRWRFVKHRT